VLDPVVLDETVGFSRTWSDDGEQTSVARKPDAVIRLLTSREAAVETRITLELVATEGRARVEIVLPDGRAETVMLGDEPVTMSWLLLVEPGTSQLVIRSADDPGRVPPVALGSLSAVTPTVSAFLDTVPGIR